MNVQVDRDWGEYVGQTQWKNNKSLETLDVSSSCIKSVNSICEPWIL